ncbi:hypothetical protein EVG20_g4445 [Dentipellis fragilis]|uniref:RNase III domain-containing protein n=1 Tax=Dentipellis fragilis TaxID=205917 RepID=A0A4Y9YYK3_9AGAM|nr:hypothetical protein EVG20_g4445 [Dentipellis fragilis]
MSSGFRTLQHAKRAIHAATPRSVTVLRASAERRRCLHYATAATETMVPQPAFAHRAASTSTPASSSSTPSTADPRLAQHLSTVFAPLEFPADLASRALTHTSHKDAKQGHNARLSFIGRRVLESYMLLFIHSAPGLNPKYDYSNIAARAINTYVLGEHIAPRWNLSEVVRWTPPREVRAGNADELRSVGLFKVHGTTVEAVMGGIFHQFGGSVAHRVFHTRLLPHILLPGKPEGLVDSLHEHALDVTRKMGGPEGPLEAPAASSHS